MLDRLIRTNIEKCSFNKWHMILASNSITNDTFYLPNNGYYETVNILRFESKSPKDLTMEDYWL